jgi:uncharacterized protein with von Willebrand factor type A (vWA) domain
VTEPLVRFGRALREEGLAVGTGRILVFCRAAALVGPDGLYWAGRSTLVAGPEEIPAYDAAFERHFGRKAGARPRSPMRVRVEGSLFGVARASRGETLRRKSFAELTDAELVELGLLAARIGLAVPDRRTRRRRPGAHGAPDVRRTLRRSLRSGGDPAEPAWRARRRRRRRLVLLLDVSRSMRDHSRGLLAIAHGALRQDPRWEAFCFGTRLTRVTRALAAADPETALARAADEVLDWDGGTRIGESVKAFLDRYGHAGTARGAVVVLASDGLDVGDPELVAAQMARLQRLAHRVVWLNPLKASADYEPLARGMRAALPYVDVFASGHNLETVVDALERAGA